MQNYTLKFLLKKNPPKEEAKIDEFFMSFRDFLWKVRDFIYFKLILSADKIYISPWPLTLVSSTRS